MRLKPVTSLKVRKNGQQKTYNLFCNIAAKGDERRCCAFYRFDVGGKTRNIAVQLVLQQCCKTSCAFFVARFSVP